MEMRNRVAVGTDLAQSLEVGVSVVGAADREALHTNLAVAIAGTQVAVVLVDAAVAAAVVLEVATEVAIGAAVLAAMNAAAPADPVAHADAGVVHLARAAHAAHPTEEVEDIVIGVDTVGADTAAADTAAAEATVEAVAGTVVVADTTGAETITTTGVETALHRQLMEKIQKTRTSQPRSVRCSKSRATPELCLSASLLFVLQLGMSGIFSKMRR